MASTRFEFQTFDEFAYKEKISRHMEIWSSGKTIFNSVFLKRTRQMVLFLN